MTIGSEAIQHAIAQGIQAAVGAMRLVNRIADATAISPKGENDMAKKIRRPMIVDGEKQWIRAESEQEYAEKVARAFEKGHKPDSRHHFPEYAYKWFREFSKPNVEKTTEITCERQLKLHICPVPGEKNAEDITPRDVRKCSIAWGMRSKRQRRKQKLS